MPSDFDASRSAARFPPTRPSAIGALGSDDAAERARAFELLLRAYWKPVYKHVRLKWRRDAEESADVTQGFFARALEKRHFGSYEPGRARFRTYLKGSLDKYVLELTRDASRQKRGGGALRISLDFDVAEDELASSGVLERAMDARSIDSYFELEWTKNLFTAALGALEASCARQSKQVYFEVFRRYVLEPELTGSERVSYADVARACAVSVTDVTNYLSWTKRELRARVLDELREITTSEEELREEARAVLGVDP